MSGSRVFGRILEVAGLLVAQRIRGMDPPTEPYLDPPTLAALDGLLKGCRLFLEFGSGGSTLWADRRGIRTISVDSDRFFAAAVRRSLSAGSNVTVLHADIGITEAWGAPVLRRPTPARLRRWRRYLDAPFALVAETGGFPDLVLVDGRFRAACALESARQAQARGAATTILFDDYAGRDFYQGIEAQLGAPERIGRAALFRVAAGSAPVITETDVAAALRDHR
jgi:hypothetical protein